MGKSRIVILGAGYGGLAVMRRMARMSNSRDYDITVVDKSQFHCINTRFHQIAVSPERDILVRLPVKALTDISRAGFVRAEVNGLDFDAKTVETDSGNIEYDRLVVAMGGETNFFNVRGARAYCATMQNYENAADCGRRIESLGMKNARSRKRIVICGGGLIGIEFAAQLREYYGRRKCEIVVVEKMKKIIPASSCPDFLRRYAKGYLGLRDIRFINGKSIAKISDGKVTLENGDELECDLAVWTGGLKRAEAGGLKKGSKFTVNEYLQHPDYPDVFGLGDFAVVDSKRDFANSMTAQRALYQADILAENIRRYENGRILRRARYKPLGEMISLGDFDGAGIVAGIPQIGAPLAAIKKSNEAKYLAALLGNLPYYPFKAGE